MIPKVKLRISFWFSPNEKPMNAHIDGTEMVEGALQLYYNTVAQMRYPNTFNTGAHLLMWPYPVPGKPPRQYIGDPGGINAFYTITPVLECDGKYYELRELPA
jgi:hypothetical protein